MDQGVDTKNQRKYILTKGINWEKPGNIDENSFQIKDKEIEPGTEFTKLGSGRTCFDIGTNIVYKGRKGTDLYFQPVQPEERQLKLFDDVDDDEADDWYICVYYVSNDVLLAQSSERGFYDIEPELDNIKEE